MSANNFKVFYASDNTVTYVSSPIQQDSNQNRSVVFQANVNTGDTVVLQARLDSSMEWVNILTATDDDIMQEVITAAEFRISVTNTSGLAVKCAMAV